MLKIVFYSIVCIYIARIAQNIYKLDYRDYVGEIGNRTDMNIGRCTGKNEWKTRNKVVS